DLHEIEAELPDVRRLLAGRVAPHVTHAVLVVRPPNATPADEPALVAGNPDLVAIHAGRVDHHLGAAGVDDLSDLGRRDGRLGEPQAPRARAAEDLRRLGRRPEVPTRLALNPLNGLRLQGREERVMRRVRGRDAEPLLEGGEIDHRLAPRFRGAWSAAGSGAAGSSMGSTYPYRAQASICASDASTVSPRSQTTPRHDQPPRITFAFAIVRSSMGPGGDQPPGSLPPQSAAIWRYFTGCVPASTSAPSKRWNAMKPTCR